MSVVHSRTTEVAVIGGGVIGLSIAARLAADGRRVTVLERDRVGHGTSWHAAGMLAPISEVAATEQPLLELGLRSMALWPCWSGWLGGDVVATTVDGALMVARDGDEAAALERELELRRSLGLKVTRLLGSEARRREPALAPGLRMALEVDSDSALDPRVLTRVLAAMVRGAGGEVLEHVAVTGVEQASGRVGGVRLADGTILGCEWVVIATGVWAGADSPGTLSGLGEVVPVVPVKGQIMRLHDPAGPGLVTRVIRMGSRYLVPRGDGRYVLGATSEERGFDQTVTVGAAWELLRDASELIPGVSELVIDEFTAGLRPGTPDNLPAIGPGAIDGLIWAVGHRRSGVLLAPITAEMVCGMVAGRCAHSADPADPMVRVLDPARFGGVAAR